MPDTLTLADVAAQEGLKGAVVQKIYCTGCRRFLADVYASGKSAQEHICGKCRTRTIVVIDTDRLTVIRAE